MGLLCLIGVGIHRFIQADSTHTGFTKTDSEKNGMIVIGMSKIVRLKRND